MEKLITGVVVVAVATALVGCGGPNAKLVGKQAAAEALFAASTPTRTSAQRGAQVSVNVNVANPLDLSAALTMNCAQGGNVSLSGFVVGNLATGSTSIDQSFTMTYSNCGLATSDVGVASYNGAFTLTQHIDAQATHASVSNQVKGRVTVNGAFDDFIDADIVQSVSVSALGGSGAVTQHLKGTITTSNGTFTYDEDVTVTAGHVTATILATK